MTQALTILMSRLAAHRFEAGVAAVMGDAPFRIVGLDAAPDSGAGYAIDLAFLSRDVTADSGKTTID